MEVKTTVDGALATLEVSGKLTVQTAPNLSAAIEALPQDVTELVIDLTDVDYIASAGLRVLVAAEKMAVSRSGKMRLLNPCEGVYEVFEMTGLTEIFTIER